MTLIKICGLTNLADALAAARAGADFLGFIFYPPSPRAANEAEVMAIVRALRQEPYCPRLVGVFVNEMAATMAGLLDRCGLDLAQLHGDETPNLIGDPASPLYGRSYKVLKPASLAEAEAEMEWYLPPEPQPGDPTILIDTAHPTLHGGTGEIVDWSMAATLAKEQPGFMLAGGLNPDNVAAAIHQVHPFAVDVASGVEASKGVKDHEKVRAFVRAVRSC